jgi:hypothetical protein
VGKDVLLLLRRPGGSGDPGILPPVGKVLVFSPQLGDVLDISPSKVLVVASRQVVRWDYCTLRPPNTSAQEVSEL